MNIQIVEPYKKYLIVWMDILGFKNRVRKSCCNQSEIMGIVDTLKLADKLAQMSPANKIANLRANIFSDSIFMSCSEPDSNALYAALGMASIYQATMATRGYFLRGAAIVGAHYLEGNIAFGPTVIEALELEKLAVWARVIIDPNLLDQLETLNEAKWKLLKELSDLPLPVISVKEDYDRFTKAHKEGFAQVFLKRGSEGIQYIDYLRFAFDTFAALKLVSPLSKDIEPNMREIIDMDLFREHGNAIKEAIKFFKDDIEILAKYHSLAIYHNEAVDTICQTLSDEFDAIETCTNPDFIFICGVAVAALYQSGVRMTKNDRNDYLKEKINQISKRGDEFKECKIELPKVFPRLYH